MRVQGAKFLLIKTSSLLSYVGPYDTSDEFRCGDGFLSPATSPPEQCDDGNTLGGDGCSPSCTCEGALCSYTVTPDVHLGSVVTNAMPGSMINLSPGNYSDWVTSPQVLPSTCYLAAPVGITLVGMGDSADSVVFNCSQCAGTTVVLGDPVGVSMLRLRTQGLTVVGTPGRRAFRLTDSVVADSQAGLLQSGLHVFGVAIDVLVTRSNIANNLGGGIMFNITQGKLEIIASAVDGNRATNGAGIKVVNGGAQLVNSSVTHNMADGIGGGICFIAHDSLGIHGSLISGNQALGQKVAGNGGGIFYNSPSTGALSIIASNVTDNQAGTLGSGAGCYALALSLVLVDSLFQGNVASYGGGGVYFDNAAGAASVLRSTLADNSAKTSGGGLQLLSGNVTIAQSEVLRNLADNDGGGVWYDGGGVAWLIVRTSDLRRNTAKAKDGGGIRAANGDVMLYDSLLEANIAGTDGGALSLTGASGGKGLWSVVRCHFDLNSGFRGGAISFANATHVISSSVADFGAGAGRFTFLRRSLVSLFLHAPYRFRTSLHSCARPMFLLSLHLAQVPFFLFLRTYLVSFAPPFVSCARS